MIATALALFALGAACAAWVGVIGLMSTVRRLTAEIAALEAAIAEHHATLDKAANVLTLTVERQVAANSRTRRIAWRLGMGAMELDGAVVKAGDN